MDRTRTPAGLDYDAPDTLVVADPERLRALADDLRSKIVMLLRERAYSTTELAELLGVPKGTVGHHLKVLERAELIRVVRTRQVRAVTEKYYGRTARLFILQSEKGGEDAIAVALREAADELAGSAEILGFAAIHLRLDEAEARKLSERLKRVVTDYRARESKDGSRYGFAVALYRREA